MLPFDLQSSKIQKLFFSKKKLSTEHVKKESHFCLKFFFCLILGLINLGLFLWDAFLLSLPRLTWREKLQILQALSLYSHIDHVQPCEIRLNDLLPLDNF